MIIDNLFTIKTYLGSEALPLFNAPSGLANSSTYTTFMNNISTIYGTQNSNGSIPVFYKTNNTPDPKSSLLSLEPNKSYYFISKANSSFPYNIPYGGFMMPAPYNNCPSIDLIPQQISLNSSSGNYYYFNQDISNLNVGYEYVYKFTTLSSNWPVSYNPSSGLLCSSKNLNNIASVIRFDRDVNVNDYSLFLPSGVPASQLDRNNLFAVVQVSMESTSNISCPKVVDIITIGCNNCIPQPSPTPTATPTPTPTRLPVFDTTLTISGSTTSAGESGAGVNFKGSLNDTLEFNINSAPDAPAIMRIIINSVQVAQVTFPYNSYVNKAFRYSKNGVKYSGSFVMGDAVLA